MGKEEVSILPIFGMFFNQMKVCTNTYFVKKSSQEYFLILNSKTDRAVLLCQRLRAETTLFACLFSEPIQDFILLFYVSPGFGQQLEPFILAAVRSCIRSFLQFILY